MSQQGQPGTAPPAPLRPRVRLLAALAAGVAAAGAAVAAGLSPGALALAGADGFFVAYLALALRFLRQSPETLRHHAEEEDESAPLAVALAALALGVALFGILSVLSPATPPTRAEVVLAFAAVPLGWAAVHMVATHRYAHLHWRRDAAGAAFGFPGHAMPGPVEFTYLAFGIGMTAQTADVSVNTPAARAAVLVHSIAAFFMNTVIVALTVSAAAGLIG